MRQEETIGLLIDIAFGRQTAKNHPVDAQLPADVNVDGHALQLIGRVNEIPSPIPDDDMQPRCGELLARHLDFSIRRCGAPFGYSHAQLHAIGTAFLRSKTAFHAVGTNLYFNIISFHRWFRLLKW